LCATVLKAFGLPVAACRPWQFEDMGHWSSNASTVPGGPFLKVTSGLFACPRKTCARPRAFPRCQGTPGVAAAVRLQLPQDFPLPLADSILGGLQDAAHQLTA
jgi:hypothetical protein